MIAARIKENEWSSSKRENLSNQCWNQKLVDQTDLHEKNKIAAECKDEINIVKQYQKMLNVQNVAIYIGYKRGEKEIKVTEAFSKTAEEAGLWESLIFWKMDLLKLVKQVPKIAKVNSFNSISKEH